MSANPPEPPDPQAPSGPQPLPVPPPPYADPAYPPPPYGPGPESGQAPWAVPAVAYPGGPAGGYPPPAPKRNTTLLWVLGAIGAFVVLGAIIAGAVTLSRSSKPPATGGTSVIASAPASASAPTSASAPATTSAPASGAPSGYVLFHDAKDSVSLSVPSAWRQIDVSSSGSVQAMQQFEADNPTIKALLGSQDLASAGVKFLALSTDKQGQVNLAARPAPGVNDSDLASVVPELKTQYQQAGITLVDTKTVQLAGHQALKIDARLSANGPSGQKVAMSMAQYFLAANDEIYVLTLSGSAPEFPTVLQTLSVS